MNILVLGSTGMLGQALMKESDFATTADVLEEVILEYKKRGLYFDYLCCLYPTALFITPEKLRRAIALLVKTGADSVLPVTRFSYPIQRALKIEAQVQTEWVTLSRFSDFR